jgi:hypothetical protein
MIRRPFAAVVDEVSIFGAEVVVDVFPELDDVGIDFGGLEVFASVAVVGDGDVGRRSVEGMGLALGRRQEWTEGRDGTEVEEMVDLLEVGVVLGEDGADPVGVAVPVAVDAGDGAVVVELADEGAGCHGLNIPRSWLTLHRMKGDLSISPHVP